jgi:multidrug transporter EmrE-like cation transporter
MNFVTALIIVAAGIINAGGSSLLKYATIYKGSPNARTALFSVLIAAAIALFTGGFPLYAMALSRAKLSAAQPVFSATTYIATFIVSLLILREPLVPLRAS